MRFRLQALLRISPNRDSCYMLIHFVAMPEDNCVSLPFLKPYNRHICDGFLASGGSWCTSTTPLTVLVSAASLPDKAKLASGSGFSSLPCFSSGPAGKKWIEMRHTASTKTLMDTPSLLHSQRRRIAYNGECRRHLPVHLQAALPAVKAGCSKVSASHSSFTGVHTVYKRQLSHDCRSSRLPGLPHCSGPLSSSFAHRFCLPGFPLAAPPGLLPTPSG